METLQYTWIDKSGWVAGPWQTEPDKVQWADPATGMPCLIVRSVASGALCGYVGVEKPHPFYGEGDIFADGVSALEVNGGVTFVGPCQTGIEVDRGICHIPGEGETEDVWWIGFDCAHGWDISPYINTILARYSIATLSERTLDLPDPWNPTYKTVAFVTQEVERLALQLEEVKGNA